MPDTRPPPAPPPENAAPTPRGWPPGRTARLGFLVGLGWDARDVGGDPRIAASPGAVRRQARRLGLAFREATGPRLPHAVVARLAAAAARRGLDPDALVHRLLLNAGSDDALIDNILDDAS